MTVNTPTITTYGSDPEDVNSSVNCGGANLLLFFSTTSGTPTYAGASLTLWKTITGGSAYATIYVWYKESPATGTNTLYQITPNLSTATWVALSNVDLTNWKSGAWTSRTGDGNFTLSGTQDGAQIILVGTNYTTSAGGAPPSDVNISGADAVLAQQSDGANGGEDSVTMDLYRDIIPGGGGETYTIDGANTTTVATAFAVEIVGTLVATGGAEFEFFAQMAF